MHRSSCGGEYKPPGCREGPSDDQSMHPPPLSSDRRSCSELSSQKVESQRADDASELKPQPLKAELENVGAVFHHADEPL